MAYKHTNTKGTDYYLHSQEVVLRGSGVKRRIYFFRKDVRDNAEEGLPEGYQVVENPRTGLPTLKKA